MATTGSTTLNIITTTTSPSSTSSSRIGTRSERSTLTRQPQVSSNFGVITQKIDKRIHIFAGQYAIYKTQSFYDYFDFIANTYHNLTPSAINPVFHDGDLTFCMRKFGDGVVFPNLTWTIDFNHLVPVEKCIVVDLKNAERPFSSRDYLKKMNFEVPWHTLQDMRLNFTLKTLTYIKVSERQPF